MIDDAYGDTIAGAPQGGSISPLSAKAKPENDPEKSADNWILEKFGG